MKQAARPFKLGLIGAGGIAHEVARAVRDGRIPSCDIVGIAAREPASARSEELASLTGAPLLTIEELLRRRPDCALEAAGAEAVHAFGPAVLAAGVDLIVMSIGALLDDALRRSLEDARADAELILPSGAIAGLDGVRAFAQSAAVTEARITTTKPPRSLAGAKYLLDHHIDLPADAAMTVFEGTAREAVKGFPRNINVSAALSLAGIGPDRTIVKIVSDPAVTRSTHEIWVSGPAGELMVTARSHPLPTNPRTSALAAMSAILAVADARARRNR